MNIYIFANDVELVTQPILASSKEDAQSKLKEIHKKSIDVVNSNIDKLKEEIVSCSKAIEEYNKELENGDVKKEDIEGFDFIDFQKELIAKDEKEIIKQNKKLEYFNNIGSLECFIISEKV